MADLRLVQPERGNAGTWSAMRESAWEVQEEMASVALAVDKAVGVDAEFLARQAMHAAVIGAAGALPGLPGVSHASRALALAKVSMCLLWRLLASGLRRREVRRKLRTALARAESLHALSCALSDAGTTFDPQKPSLSSFPIDVALLEDAFESLESFPVIEDSYCDSEAEELLAQGPNRAAALGPWMGGDQAGAALPSGAGQGAAWGRPREGWVDPQGGPGLVVVERPREPAMVAKDDEPDIPSVSYARESTRAGTRARARVPGPHHAAGVPQDMSRGSARSVGAAGWSRSRVGAVPSIYDAEMVEELVAGAADLWGLRSRQGAGQRRDARVGEAAGSTSGVETPKAESSRQPWPSIYDDLPTPVTSPVKPAASSHAQHSTTPPSSTRSLLASHDTPRQRMAYASRLAAAGRVYVMDPLLRGEF